MLDKEQLKQQVIKHLEGKIHDLSQVVESATLEVTSGDNKQESKYDTRAIEASYLAGAQKARLEVLKTQLNTIKLLDVTTASVSIKLGSLVKVLKNQKEEQYLFFTPNIGGEKIMVNRTEILLMAMSNPLAIEFADLEIGDEFLFEETDNEYEVLGIY